MEHVVFFPSHDGTPAFRRIASFEDAVRLVEHLRNVEGISEVSCHALTEVPLAFRAYYRVEMPGSVEEQAPVAGAPVQLVADETPAAEQEAQPQAEAVAAQVMVAPDEVPGPEPIMVSSNGRANDGAKSLGFFA